MMIKEINMKDYTKISIHRDLHDLVKKISDETGIKMYRLEDEAIKEYIEKKYPEYSYFKNIIKNKGELITE